MSTAIVRAEKPRSLFPNRQLQERLDRLSLTQRDALLDFVAAVLGLEEGDSLETAKEEDTIWVHDYHLMLLPGIIRKELSNSTIGFFLHTPFPSYEVFRLLPYREEILQGLH